MNKQPTQEQIRELWEWCEREQWENLKDANIIRWVDKEGNLKFVENLPSIDLNNLFKYAVPKLDYVELKFASKAPFTSIMILHENQEYFGKDKDSALALFWAIYKVIKNEH